MYIVITRILKLVLFYSDLYLLSNAITFYRDSGTAFLPGGDFSLSVYCYTFGIRTFKCDFTCRNCGIGDGITASFFQRYRFLFQVENRFFYSDFTRSAFISECYCDISCSYTFCCYFSGGVDLNYFCI